MSRSSRSSQSRSSATPSCGSGRPVRAFPEGQRPEFAVLEQQCTLWMPERGGEFDEDLGHQSEDVALAVQRLDREVEHLEAHLAVEREGVAAPAEEDVADDAKHERGQLLEHAVQ